MEHREDMVEQVLNTHAETFKIGLSSTGQIGPTFQFALGDFEVVLVKPHRDTVHTAIHLVEVADVRYDEWSRATSRDCALVCKTSQTFPSKT